MNKIGVVLGVATVAVLSGCMDPNYKGHRKSVFNTNQPVATDVVEPAKPVQPVQALPPDTPDATTTIVVNDDTDTKPVVKPAAPSAAKPAEAPKAE